MQRWTDLTEAVKRDIERKYCAGKTPAELAPLYKLNPKQISDQAYRKGWQQTQLAMNRKTGKAAKKNMKKTAKAKPKTKGRPR